MSVTYTEIIRADVNHTSVCTIRRLLSFNSAKDGGILKAARYNPSRQLLKDRCIKFAAFWSFISVHQMKFMGTTQGMPQRKIIFGNFQMLLFENWSDIMESNFSRLERFISTNLKEKRKKSGLYLRPFKIGMICLSQV